MIDIKKIVSNTDEVIKNLNKRNKNYTDTVRNIKKDYEEYVTLLKQEEEAKSKINNLSKQIGILKKQNEPVDPVLQEINELKVLVKGTKSKKLKENFEKKLLTLPNLLDKSVKKGIDEEDNEVIKIVGEIPEFSFEVSEHQKILQIEKDFDFERASKIAKSRFIVSYGFVAKLERAITNFMLDTHIKKGYIETQVPFIVSDETLLASSQLPKFADDLFKIENSSKEENEKDFYLIPTAEVCLAGLHRDEILDIKKLPEKYVAYSQCFRKEAGSAGKDTRGIIRMHQFGKVELFKYVLPEKSFEELEIMTSDAEDILKALKLPYRVVSLCSGDIGFSATKTYDLEVWFPFQKKYRECSSISNVGDFQARRGAIRYKDENKKNNYVHMLNGSGMATGRILAAILENYQNADGTVTIPEVLQQYF